MKKLVIVLLLITAVGVSAQKGITGWSITGVRSIKNPLSSLSVFENNERSNFGYGAETFFSIANSKGVLRGAELKYSTYGITPVAPNVSEGVTIVDLLYTIGFRRQLSEALYITFTGKIGIDCFFNGYSINSGDAEHIWRWGIALDSDIKLSVKLFDDTFAYLKGGGMVDGALLNSNVSVPAPFTENTNRAAMSLYLVLGCEYSF